MSSACSPGAVYRGDGRCRFRVWAPRRRQVELRLLEPAERSVPLARTADGFHQALVEDVTPGALYRYRLDDELERPDPASRHQPRGVHGPSRVIDPAFDWDDADWRPPTPRELVLYELHVGTFSPAGTFAGVEERLDELLDLGVNAIELMPVAQFPGARNWGYDGAALYAVQDSYGGPDGLRQLVRACHRRGLAVYLDVVYNHLGPEGNYLADYGPYFTDTYRTPWGQAINFDGPDSDAVREFFVENALYWLREFHIDGLRLDAIHAIHDRLALPFLEQLVVAAENQARRIGRPARLIGESHSNDSRLVERRGQGGVGLDAVWSDDLHHALHTLLTGESDGYYVDYGSCELLERALRDGFAYAGHYSQFRRHSYGRSARHLPADRFVVFSQNHDQIGNRRDGERLGALVSFEALKLAAACVLLSPGIPLLFMGEEYGETSPFLYFTSHGDPGLVEAVRRGRREEFAAFGWQGEVPDPQDEATFARSKLHSWPGTRPEQGALRDLYRELLRLRREHPALASREPQDVEARRLPDEQGLVLCRRGSGSEIAAVLFFRDTPSKVDPGLPAGRWSRLLDTSESCWHGPGSDVPETIEANPGRAITLAPFSAILLERLDP